MALGGAPRETREESSASLMWAHGTTCAEHEAMMRARVATGCLLAFLFVSAGASASQTGAPATPAPGAAAGRTALASRIAAAQARTYRYNSARPPGVLGVRAWVLNRQARKLGLPETALPPPQPPGVPVPQAAAAQRSPSPQWRQPPPAGMSSRFKSFLTQMTGRGTATALGR